MMNSLRRWEHILACPLDRTALQVGDGSQGCCPTCSFTPELAAIGPTQVPDFRALGTPQTIRLPFVLPVQPLDRQDVAARFFKASSARFDHLTERFGSKLDPGHQFYCQQILREHGPDAPVLDLGCGSAGNRRYLEAVGFQRVLAVDWSSPHADLLVDAHRLPFADQSFQMIISTAVFEHLYHPFIAAGEIARVLKPGGSFIGGASFWEAWHGSSYFHITPDGWNVLLQSAGLTLEDLWPGWGVIPALLTHVLIPGRFRRAGYRLQRLVEAVYRLALKETGVRKLQLRASGSYHVYARKRALAAPPDAPPSLDL